MDNSDNRLKISTILTLGLSSCCKERVPIGWSFIPSRLVQKDKGDGD